MKLQNIKINWSQLNLKLLKEITQTPENVNVLLVKEIAE